MVEFASNLLLCITVVAMALLLTPHNLVIEFKGVQTSIFWSSVVPSSLGSLLRVWSLVLIRDSDERDNQRSPLTIRLLSGIE
jgi:hypothetical protein